MFGTRSVPSVYSRVRRDVRGTKRETNSARRTEKKVSDRAQAGRGGKHRRARNEAEGNDWWQTACVATV